MSGVVLILAVIVVLALAMWLVYYIRFPPGSPVWIKNFLYVLLILVAIVVILTQTGLLHGLGG